MMFADDVILMSSTAKGLQRSFDVAGEFAKVWRFKYNLGVDKTAVMVFGGVREGGSWCVGECNTGGAELSVFGCQVGEWCEQVEGKEVGTVKEGVRGLLEGVGTGDEGGVTDGG